MTIFCQNVSFDRTFLLEECPKLSKMSHFWSIFWVLGAQRAPKPLQKPSQVFEPFFDLFLRSKMAEIRRFRPKIDDFGGLRGLRPPIETPFLSQKCDFNRKNGQNDHFSIF
jgi:hypothetical protein